MSTISAFLSLFRSHKEQPQINENEVWANVERARKLATSSSSIAQVQSVNSALINENELWERVAQHQVMYPAAALNPSMQAEAERLVGKIKMKNHLQEWDQYYTDCQRQVDDSNMFSHQDKF